MNLQATTADAHISAMSMDDKRVSKMILETAQMYCTATNNTRYKPTHASHPLVEWCKHNTSWLIMFHQALAHEYFYRHQVIHSSFRDVGQYMPEPTPHTPTFRNHARSPKIALNNQPIDFTDIADVHLAYRYYLRARWRHDTIRARWTRRQPPVWLDEPLINRGKLYPLMITSRDVVQSGHNEWSCIYGK